MTQRLSELAGLSMPEKRALLAQMLKERVTQSRSFPLSFAQQRLWLLEQLEPGTSVYNLPLAYGLKGALNVAALESSLNEIINRHESLRTTFSKKDDEPVQVITSFSPSKLEIVQLTHLDTDARQTAVKKLVNEAAQRPFDLTRGPLFRARLLRLSDEEHVLMLTLHHIVGDGWSLSILLRELNDLYCAFCDGKQPSLPRLPLQYADYAIWSRQHSFDSQIDYWRKQLHECPTALEFPFSERRKPSHTYDGAAESFRLPSELAAGLRALARREDVTLFMVLVAGFNALLSRYTGQHDIVIGTPVAGRTRRETEGLIGFFVNTLVLRTSTSNDPSFLELLRRARETCLDAYQHQDAPFEILVEKLQPDRELSRTPLFQAMLVLQNPSAERLRLGGLKVTTLKEEIATSKFDLTLVLAEINEELVGRFEYRSEIFTRDAIKRMAVHLRTLLTAAVADPKRRLSELPLVGAEERDQLLHEWNDTEREPWVGPCVHHLFEQQVERTPDAVAIVHGQQQINYRELNERAEQLAGYLLRLGAGQHERVGLLMHSSIEMVASVFGILKAGGAYVPLDPSYPAERIRLMLEDAGVDLVLTSQRLSGVLDGARVKTIVWEDFSFTSTTNHPRVSGAGGNMVYVICTSGSTGRPKPVGVKHSGFLNLLQWFIEEFDITSLDRVLLMTSLSFDLTQKNIFAPLMTGAQLHIPAAEFYDPELLKHIVSQQRITLLNCTPSGFYPLIEQGDESSLEQLQSLRCVFLGGEPISVKRLSRWFGTGACFSEVVNTYGPTECSDIVSFYRLSPEDETSIPIGGPIYNTTLLVLDDNQQLRPVGTIGELGVTGVGVGFGYLNDPALTAEKFLPSNLSGQDGARLYRTGDLVRYRHDGEIEYVGRVDHQVKLRGFRIELGEIATVLRQHDDVREAVIVVCELGEEKRLIAYTVSTGPTRPSNTRVLEFLQQRLPPYMIPQAFVWLAEMPLSANGKIDLKALPEPELGSNTETVTEQRPLTAVEYVVATVWAEVLNLRHVGLTDNFFRLGGHSLLVMHVTSRLREIFQLDLPLRTLFESPTVEAFSEELIHHEIRPGQIENIARIFQLSRTGDSDTESIFNQAMPDATPLVANPILRVPRNGTVPLSIRQESGFMRAQWGQFLGLAEALSGRSELFSKLGSKFIRLISIRHYSRRLQQGERQRAVMSPWVNRHRDKFLAVAGALAKVLVPGALQSAGKKQTHISVATRWKGALDVAALENALNEIVRRHETLHTTFSMVDGRPVQHFNPDLKLPLAQVDLEQFAECDREGEALKVIYDEMERPFDFAVGPLLRVMLLKLSAEDHVLCLVIQHFICDGVSVGIFNHELLVLYQAFSRGEPSPLPELPIQYADYAHWQREWLQGDVVKKLIAFWDEHLTGVGLMPELELPFAGPTPTIGSHQARTETLPLPRPLSAALKSLSFENNVTMYTLFLTAWKTLLHRYTGKEYIGVMTPFANRIRPETRSLIGWFEHTMNFNTRITGNPRFSDLLRQVREDCLRAYQHQEIPASMIFTELLPRYGSYDFLLRMQRIPFVFFDFESINPGPKIDGLSIGPFNIPVTTTTPAIALRVVERGERIQLHLTYKIEIFKLDDVRQMLSEFQSLLESVVRNPEERIGNPALHHGPHTSAAAQGHSILP